MQLGSVSVEEQAKGGRLITEIRKAGGSSGSYQPPVRRVDEMGRVEVGRKRANY